MKSLIFIGLLVFLVACDTCGGNCPTGKCTNCYCGTSRKMEDINQWCSKYNWEQSCCKCIVSHESGGNAHAMNHHDDGSTDVGLWQINNVNWGGCNNGHAPCDTSQNLNCAVKVYQWASNSWKAWSAHAACGC